MPAPISRARRLALFGFLVTLTLITSIPAYARHTLAAPPTPHLRDVLAADGTLDLPPGFTGSLDPEGLTMATTGGAPRFVPTAAAGDERWDHQFGAPGVWNYSSPAEVTAIAVAPNGDLFVGGPFNKAGAIEANSIARWDGRRWHPLGAGLDQAPTEIAVSGESLYVVAYNLRRAGTAVVNDLAMWNGAAWSAVGSGVGPQKVTQYGTEEGDLNAITVIGGEVYVGGEFNQIDGVAANAIARWNGAGWSALGEGVGNLNWESQFEASGEVNAIVAAGGKLYVGGQFMVAGGQTVNSIAVWANGAWSGFGAGLEGDDDWTRAEVHAIAVNGASVYAGGRFTKAGGQPANHIAHWNGSAWAALGTGMADGPYSSEVLVKSLAFVDGALYAGGEFNSAGGQTVAAVARWDGGWSALGAGLPNDDGYASVLVIAPALEGGLYIGGDFRLAGGKRVDGIATWDGTAWYALGQGLLEQEYGDSPADIYAIAVDGAGRVYVGGRFTRAGGVEVSNIAMWDGSAWYALGSGVDGTVRALVAVGDDVYAAGSFTKAGGVSAQHIARWNRAAAKWSALGSGINGDVYALAYDGGLLFAGGGFTAAGGASAYDVAYWDGGQWHAFGQSYRVYERGKEGGEIGTTVQALAVQGDIVIVGGHFQTIHKLGSDPTPIGNYMLVNNVVGWNRATDTWFVIGPWNATTEPGVTTDGFSGFGTDVNALAISGADVFVGGDFNLAGSAAAANIARWNATTNTWAALDSGIAGFDDALYPTEVKSLAVSGTDLYVGGHFTAAGAAEARFVARWDTMTGGWSALGSGVRWYNDRYTYVHSIAATADSVYIGGDFHTAGEGPGSGFARWAPPAPAPNVTEAEGGTVAGQGGLTAVFPPYAVPGDARVQIVSQAWPGHPLPSQWHALKSQRVAAVTVDGQPVTAFRAPYVLRIPYTDADLAALKLTEASLTVWASDGTTWTRLLPCAGCGVDIANNVATVVTNRTHELVLAGAQATDPGTGFKVYVPMVMR